MSGDHTLRNNGCCRIHFDFTVVEISGLVRSWKYTPLHPAVLFCSAVLSRSDHLISWFSHWNIETLHLVDAASGLPFFASTPSDKWCFPGGAFVFIVVGDVNRSWWSGLSVCQQNFKYQNPWSAGHFCCTRLSPCSLSRPTFWDPIWS